MIDGRDSFKVDGLCWCPGERTLAHYRAMGHTQDCTFARKGWEANRRHLSELDRRDAEAKALGEALLSDARSVLAKEADRA